MCAVMCAVCVLVSLDVAEAEWFWIWVGSIILDWDGRMILDLGGQRNSGLDQADLPDLAGGNCLYT